MSQRKTCEKILPLLLWLALAGNSFALGQIQYVETIPDSGAFPICGNSSVASIVVDANDFAGVVRAAGDLQRDIARVTGLTPKMLSGKIISGTNVILIGTIGKSEIIDGLIRENKIDVSAISNQWESFFLQVVPQPLPGIENALVICGGDKRGTIYGIYDYIQRCLLFSGCFYLLGIASSGC